MKEKVTIVGGGIVGIMSAVYLEKKGLDVVLIDSGELGGLLNSYVVNEIAYDYGTHIPMSTGNTEIDGLLFSDLKHEEWEIFNDLKVASFFEGQLNLESVYPDLQLLEKPLFYKSVYELLLNNSDLTASFSNLSDFYESKFGETIKNYVYKDIFLKLTGADLKELHPKNSCLFDVNRVIIGSPLLTNELKKNILFDQVLANNIYSTVKSGKLMYYPKDNNGIGLWIKKLKEKILRSSIELKENVNIKEIYINKGKLESITLTDEQNISFDQLIWTIPVQILDNFITEERESKVNFRSTLLVNFKLSQDFLIDKHFVTCWDKNLKTFRVTLYPNLTVSLKEKGIFNCTVEIFVEPDYKFEESLYVEIQKELVIMGIIDENIEVFDKSYRFIKNAFPILTKEIFNETEEIASKIETNIDNVILCGRAKAGTFFMKDSLIDALQALEKLYEEG